MAIHVQDEETDWLVREFARQRGVGITAAIKVAVEEALLRERQSTSENVDMLIRKIQPILDDIRERRIKISQSDKEFMDDMWGN